MPPTAPDQLRTTIETLYRSESGRVLATLVRLRALRDQSAVRDYNVSSRFKSEIGLTIGEYVAMIRVRAAAELLRTTPLVIADDSRTVGYEYLQSFYRDVRKILGCTPGELRRQTGRADQVPPQPSVE